MDSPTETKRIKDNNGLRQSAPWFLAPSCWSKTFIFEWTWDSGVFVYGWYPWYPHESWYHCKVIPSWRRVSILKSLLFFLTPTEFRHWFFLRVIFSNLNHQDMSPKGRPKCTVARRKQSTRQGNSREEDLGGAMCGISSEKKNCFHGQRSGDGFSSSDLAVWWFSLFKAYLMGQDRCCFWFLKWHQKKPWNHASRIFRHWNERQNPVFAVRLWVSKECIGLQGPPSVSAKQCYFKSSRYTDFRRNHNAYGGYLSPAHIFVKKLVGNSFGPINLLRAGYIPNKSSLHHHVNSIRKSLWSPHDIHRSQS